MVATVTPCRVLVCSLLSEEMGQIMIDALRVSAIVRDCLFKNEELTSEGWAPTDAVTVKGIMKHLGFHPGRLESYREEVVGFINELNPAFLEDTGGGWTFLNLPMDKNDVQWGEQIHADELLILAMGLKLADFLMSRDLWVGLPGGMPYVVFRKTPKE